MPHSDHIDRWQRERDDAAPDPTTPAEHIERMRDLLAQAERRIRIEAEGRRIRRDNARENRYWRKVVFGCDECGVQGQHHHPACSQSVGWGRADTITEDRGER